MPLYNMTESEVMVEYASDLKSGDITPRQVQQIIQQTSQYVVKFACPQMMAYAHYPHSKAVTSLRWGRAEYERGGPARALHALGRALHMSQLPGQQPRLVRSHVEVTEDGKKVPLVMWAQANSRLPLREVQAFEADWIRSEDRPGFTDPHAKVWVPFAKDQEPPVTALFYRDNRQGRAAAGAVFGKALRAYRQSREP